MVSPAQSNEYSLANISRPQPLQTKASSAGVTLQNFILGYLSPKQTVRPDSVLEALPRIRDFLALQCTRLQALFQDIVPPAEVKVYLSAVSVLDKIAKDKKTVITDEEKKCLETFFISASQENKYLSKFDFVVQGTKLQPMHQNLKRLFKILEGDFFEQFASKLEKISRLVDTENETAEDLLESEKLNVRDGILLGMSFYMKSLAENLQERGIPEASLLFSRWQSIEKISQMPSIKRLKSLCEAPIKKGTIHINNTDTSEAITGKILSLVSIVKGVYMGKLSHIGVLVKQDNQLMLSHVNSLTNSHGVTPFRNSFLIPYYTTLNLNISALLPTSVSNEEDREILNNTFLEAFDRFSSEAHPELPIDTGYIRLFLLGHQTPSSQPLANVNLPPENTPINCSSYVGIIFLKAIQAVNKRLEELNYSERIPHPFGEHENLKNLDILRLLYLWKSLDVIEEPSLHPTVSKVFANH